MFCEGFLKPYVFINISHDISTTNMMILVDKKLGCYSRLGLTKVVLKHCWLTNVVEVDVNTDEGGLE